MIISCVSISKCISFRTLYTTALEFKSLTTGTDRQSMPYVKDASLPDTVKEDVLEQ